MRVFLYIVFTVSTVTCASQSIVYDSIKYVLPGGSTIAFTQPRAYYQYTTGDSLSARGTTSKQRVSIHPLDLPVSTLTQAALDLKSPTSHTHTFASLTSKPTTLSGYGITDAAGISHTHTISQITDFPTTTAGFSNSTNKNFVTDAQSTVIGNTSGTNTGDNATNSQYSGLISNATHTGDATGSTALTVVRINGTSLAGLATGILKNTTGTGVPSIAAAGTDYQVPITAGDVTTSGATATIGATKVTNAMLAGSIDLTTKITGILPAANGGTGVNNSTRTLTVNTNAGTIAFPTASTTQTLPIATSTVVGKVAQVDIASTASATSTATIFTPASNGMYRLSIYLKITTTGTSPVAGPVTITYTEPDGSVAQSHVMLLQSVTGTVVTTTVNNSTTTGTVNGSMTFFAKSGVAIQYAIAVSGTFAAGRYMAHITLEAL